MPSPECAGATALPAWKRATATAAYATPSTLASTLAAATLASTLAATASLIVTAALDASSSACCGLLAISFVNPIVLPVNTSDDLGCQCRGHRLGADGRRWWGR